MTQELNIEQERREFEAWYEAESLLAISDWFKKDDGGDYAYTHTDVAWGAWLAAKRSVGGGKPVAWARSWHVSGIPPEKINKKGRLVFPFSYKLLPVTPKQCLRDDVPLYRQAPPAPLSAELSEVIAALRHVADDPMWADHVEVRKDTLLAWAGILDKARAKAQHHEST